MINVVSNPPYNVSWNPQAELKAVWPFSECEMPPKSNANFAFVLTGLAKSEGRSAFILPTGVLSSSIRQEQAIRKWLVDSGLLCAVLYLPEKMFVSTQIPVCILLFDRLRSTDDVLFFDLHEQCQWEERKQRGQYGGACHMNRIYTKKFLAVPETAIEAIAGGVNDRRQLPEWAISVPRNEIARNDYLLKPALYIKSGESGEKARELPDIVNDLSRVGEHKNILRLVINHTLAQKLGFKEIVDLQEQSNAITRELAPVVEKLTGKKLPLDDYIQLSKHQNELSFQNQHPRIISEIFLSILQMYKAHLMYLNNEENRYLSELRDALLPKLMSGEIDLDQL